MFVHIYLNELINVIALIFIRTSLISSLKLVAVVFEYYIIDFVVLNKVAGNYYK